MRIKYRAAKKVYRTVKRGKISAGTGQYLARQVYHMDRSKPGGNYANPKRPR